MPGIYGPGRLGTDRLAAGTTAIAETEAGPGNRIHVDDLVRCCMAALSPEVPAGLYNVGDEAERTWSPMRLSFLNESRQVDVRKMREILRPSLAFADPVEGIARSLAAEQE